MPKLSDLCGDFCAAGSMSLVNLHRDFGAASNMDAGIESVAPSIPAPAITPKM